MSDKPTNSPPITNASELLEKYEVFFLDAYGVLIDSTNALPFAPQFLEALTARGKTYLVVTNDSVRLPETAAQFYSDKGIVVPAAKIISAGLCLEDLFRDQGLMGKRCAVAGSVDTFEYVRRAGGHPVAIDPDFDADVVIVGSDAGLSTIKVFNDLLSSIHRLIESGQPPKLVLPNTDIVYPKGGQKFGVTSGAVAGLLEQALRVLHPAQLPTFLRLGKPNRPLFERALAAVAHRGPAIMIGDQIATDIVGSNRAGLDSALLLTGLTRALPAPIGPPEERPTWVLPSLKL